MSDQDNLRYIGFRHIRSEAFALFEIVGGALRGQIWLLTKKDCEQRQKNFEERGSHSDETQKALDRWPDAWFVS